MKCCLLLLCFIIAICPDCPGQTNWYVSTTGNDANDGLTSGTAWRSIQFANNHNQVHDGDIINVSSGSYTEYINVTKSLRFYGPNRHISPNPNLASRQPEAIISAVISSPGNQLIFDAHTPGTQIEIKGFKLINGTPLKDGNVARHPNQDIVIRFEKNWVHHGNTLFAGTLTQWKTVTITDNFFEANDLTPFSSAIKLNDAKEAGVAPDLVATVKATITGNRVDGATWGGISVDNILNVSIQNNDIRNTGQFGIELAGGVGDAIVSENEIVNANTSQEPGVGGIYIYGSEFMGNITIRNNMVRNSRIGFAVRAGEEISGKQVNVTANSFDNSNSTYAIWHGGSGNLNAACNWHGSAGATVAGRIYGPITHAPHLANGLDQDPTLGFQPAATCGTAAPEFSRTLLTRGLNRPWEMLYGPDDMLWITQSNGRISRVNPNSGIVSPVYTAPDYFGGDPSMDVALLCGTYPVSAGTYGMGLHPDFINVPFIYYIYSYNAGTGSAPLSKFKVRRLTWNPITKTASNPLDIIPDLPLDLSHDGMRMLIISQGGMPYIYITAGDGSIDNDNCYPPGNNDNLRAQDWNSRFGKTLRYNIDGTIPASNPIPGSPVFTKGHRNALGLAYNPATGILYSSENGKSSDDEINILEKAKNYGWPKARGYHNDGNYPGESNFAANYTPTITGDALREPIYSWCPSAVTLPEDPQDATKTCVVAPSDMIYYGANAIPGFRNSLLVTALKNYNPAFRPGVYVFKLNSAGTALAEPEPQIVFSVPDSLSLRYRDITVSPDGRSIFICTDSWDGVDNQILRFDYQVAQPSITFSGKVLLQSPFNASSQLMNTTLNSSGMLQAAAATQPYAAIYNYQGTERVAADFFATHPEIVDWVLIELRDATNPLTIIATRAGFVQRDGTIVETDGSGTSISFPAVAPGNYHVAIRHRNHLGIRSSSAVDFTDGSGVHDFTASAASSFQNQLYTATVQAGNKWLMRGGNANSNNNTKYNGPANDQDRIQNIKLGGSLSIVMMNQYAPEDINMDGVIKTNGPNNDQNFLLNLILNGFFSTIYTEQF
ncbi:hypothetical protein EXU57_19345 [Segetibacter sp. 3557_3]|nr:PQQ-dependent sugar dehydrogenase [Segetibacter sp. 3557_3]TDH21659.1 hypothetical protein EXU57_19345 [Segetibacter sp. 3557_3]